jgi:phosphoribosylformylglycinamidine cyclo-ligase
MFRTFNCGIGMVVCVAAADVDRTLEHLESQGEIARHIGRIEAGDGEPSVILEP